MRMKKVYSDQGSVLNGQQKKSHDSGSLDLKHFLREKRINKSLGLNF